ncbi:hypothetical protein LL254_04350 [Marinobacter nauticus]|nr:hypothetical protein [Marinobacter nauticus]
MGDYLGLCGLTLPVGKDSAGMPIGMQLLMRPWQEERLLIAPSDNKLESRFPWRF